MLRIMLALMLGGLVVVNALGDEPKKPDKPAEKPPARPNDPPPRPSPERIVESILARMDTNKDGKISKDEAKDRIAENFAAIDTNKDVYLDRAELLAMARRLPPMPP